MNSVHRSLVLSLLSAVLMACAPRPAGGDATVIDTLRASGAVASPVLVNTYWKLVELDGNTVTVTDNQPEPHIVLQPDQKRLNGSGGCNRLFGSYETSGTTLTFGGVGSTKMACPSGMDTEVAFLPALDRVARWRIAGQQLELSDSTGTLLARFEARAMK